MPWDDPEPRPDGGQPVPGGSASPFGRAGQPSPFEVPTVPGSVPSAGQPPLGFGLGAAAPVVGGAASPVVTEQRQGPPLWLLLVAAGGVVLAAALRLVSDWRIDLAGWALAVGFGLGGTFAFTVRDTRARASAWYLGRDTLVRVARLALTMGAIVVAGLHAWAFADWFARLDAFA